LHMSLCAPACRSILAMTRRAGGVASDCPIHSAWACIRRGCSILLGFVHLCRPFPLYPRLRRGCVFARACVCGKSSKQQAIGSRCRVLCM
jgi:hypothetical protein